MCMSIFHDEVQGSDLENTLNTRSVWLLVLLALNDAKYRMREHR